MTPLLLSRSPSSGLRPILAGNRGAVSTAHPLATSAGQTALAMGGNAIDATIAAQAVLCVVAPNACGLGGDALALIRDAKGGVTAVNGVGLSPSDPAFVTVASRGTAVTVPGIVAAWAEMHSRYGRLDPAITLRPAIDLARGPARLSRGLVQSVVEQKERLEDGGADDWPVVKAALAGTAVRQPELAAVLERFAADGPTSFYSGALAKAMVDAIRRHGGLMSRGDFESHRTLVCQPVATQVDRVKLTVQPPPSQGVMLAMAFRHLAGLEHRIPDLLDHSGIELTLSAFEHRDHCAMGASLLELDLHHDPTNASRRQGPRAYLHTAGVAVSDSAGQVVSSLVSVFDDFGSCIFVPEGGFILNNRAQGFTTGANRPRPAAYPIHTLAPAMIETGDTAIALATPGADGQVQALLQVLTRLILLSEPLATAIDAPRWRSENGRLLIERGHPSTELLAQRGHDIDILPAGDDRFGGLVCAGTECGVPFAGGDWRREVWPGVA